MQGELHALFEEMKDRLDLLISLLDDYENAVYLYEYGYYVHDNFIESSDRFIEVINEGLIKDE